VSDQSWTEPGAHPVADGVHRIPLPLPMDGLRAVNVYVLETADGLVLVDGGWAIPESRAQFDVSLKEIGCTVADIRRFLVTHMHRDHYTQAVAVRREVGSHVVLGIGEKATLDLVHDDVRREDPTVARLRAAGADVLAEGWRATVPSRPPVDDFGYPDEWLEADGVIEVGARSLDAVSTPGHTQGHFVFADRAAGLLFAGDHVLPTITPSIGFEPAYVQQPLRDFLGSLAKVRAMPDLLLLPAHGPVSPSSHARIDELVSFHDVRLSQSLAAVEAGATDAWAVARELPWTRRQRRATDLNPFDAVLAAFETLAHLELLAARGQLSRTEDDGTVRFGPVTPSPPAVSDGHEDDASIQT
jgi:glyoxylase-like metal-dependent hydrolase (beta-lactamase superfamily II)